MEQWAFEPKQEPKIDKFTYVYTHIYIYKTAGRSVFLVGLLPQAQNCCLHNEENGTMNPT